MFIWLDPQTSRRNRQLIDPVLFTALVVLPTAAYKSSQFMPKMSLYLGQNKQSISSRCCIILGCFQVGSKITFIAKSEKTRCSKKFHCMDVLSFNGLDSVALLPTYKNNIFYRLVESNPVKLETSSTVLFLLTKYVRLCNIPQARLRGRV